MFGRSEDRHLFLQIVRNVDSVVGKVKEMRSDGRAPHLLVVDDSDPWDGPLAAALGSLQTLALLEEIPVVMALGLQEGKMPSETQKADTIVELHRPPRGTQREDLAEVFVQEGEGVGEPFFLLLL